MVPRACFIFACLLPTLTAWGAERDVTQAFPVKPGCTLNVELYLGRITVEESDALEVKVNLHADIAAETEEAAERAGRALQFSVGGRDNTVAAVVRNPAGRGWHFEWKTAPSVDVSCTVSVPRQCNVDLRTGGGAITVGNLTGRVFARAESGTIFVRRIDGEVDAATDSGDVIVSRCLGATTLKTLRGTIRTGPLGARAKITNNTGDIEVDAARAGISAYAEMGDVKIGFPRDFTGDSEIRTARGNIIATIDPRAEASIMAQAVWGRVQSDLVLVPEPGAASRGKLTGRLNRGGPRLTFYANGGDVRLKPASTVFD